MARLYRPYMPLSVKIAVVTRDLIGKSGPTAMPAMEIGVDTQTAWLRKLTDRFAAMIGCCPGDLRFDHDPALALRPQMRRGLGRKTYYIPDANDPAHIFVRPHGAEFEGSHDIKTRIRGDHGQFSDVALIKRERRRQRKKSEKKTRRLALTKPKRAVRKKFRWPKRRFEKRRK